MEDFTLWNKCGPVEGENVVLKDEWGNVDGMIERCHCFWWHQGKDSGDSGCGVGRNDGNSCGSPFPIFRSRWCTETKCDKGDGWK